MNDTWVAGFLLFHRAREAVASVSLSHPPDCGCVVCKAAEGDMDAMAEVLAVMQEDGEQIHVWKPEP